MDTPVRYDLAESTCPPVRLGELGDPAELAGLPLGYGTSRGDDELRELIAAEAGVHPDQVLVTVGAIEAMFLLAVISLSLGVINLFPFLPLDGGHIFWALAEKIRGRAIPFAVMERAGFVGFALVLVLFMIGFTNDLGRLGEGFGGR